METKKSEKANLESKKPIFFQIGIIAVLAIVLVAFEWSTKPSTNEEYISTINEIVFEEEMIITKREEPKKEVVQPQVLEVLEIVDDDIEIEDFIFDVEVDENTEYDFIINDDDNSEEIIEEDIPFVIVSNMPKFQGGDLNTFWVWCQEHAIYPEIASENGVSGVVTIQFVINKQGYVDKVEVIRSADPALDKEAIRVVKSSPRWTPGDQRGKPASVMMTLPIRFVLQ